MRQQVCAALALAALVLAVTQPAWAVPPGFTLKFDGNGEGEVVFTGAKHTGKGMHCADCHLEVFDTSRSAQIKRADHKRKQFCFTCHDGVVAFAPRSNCDRCHAEIEPVAEPGAATAAVPLPPAPN